MLSNGKQELFCHMYFKHGRMITPAAVAAGFSPTYAPVLFKLPHIRARIKELNQLVFDKQIVTIDRVVSELAAIGFASVADFLKFEDGQVVIVDLASVPEAAIRALKEITIVQSGQGAKKKTTIRIKLHDKTMALEKLGKALGMYKKGADPLAGGKRLTGQVFKGPARVVSKEGAQGSGDYPRTIEGKKKPGAT